MTSFIEFDLTFDHDQLTQDAFDRIAERFPGWTPNEAHLEVATIEELAFICSELARIAVDVPPEIFREFGRKIVGLAPGDGEPAATLVTVTATDALGYTVEEGMPLVYQSAGDDPWLFRVSESRVIIPSQTFVTGVPIVADEVGTSRNDIATDSSLEPVDALTWVDSIVTELITGGGVDAETDDEYLDRLAEHLTLLAPRPILARDFALFAKTVEGVHRALAIDNYNPADETDDNERMVAVAGVDENGDALSAGIKTSLDQALQAVRETNFIINVMDPTYTDIAVVFSAVAEEGTDPDLVEADAVQAISDYLDPAQWAGGDEEPPVWRDELIVRYLEIAEVINSVVGIDHITTTAGDFDLTVNGARLDVTLTGRAALPSRVELDGSTVTGTVT